MIIFKKNSNDSSSGRFIFGFSPDQIFPAALNGKKLNERMDEKPGAYTLPFNFNPKKKTPHGIFLNVSRSRLELPTFGL